MDKENKIWTMSWTQTYDTWPRPAPRTAEYTEPEITDFAQARAKSVISGSVYSAGRATGLGQLS